MAHTRHEGEKVDAFSAPRSLLDEAQKRAQALKMTKSGYYRYCLAKEIGKTEAEARALAEHGAVKRSRELLEASSARVSPVAGIVRVLKKDFPKRTKGTGAGDRSA